MFFKKLKRSDTKSNDASDVKRSYPSIEVMLDYGTWPIWLRDKEGDIRESVDPRTLPISDTLAKKILEWSAIHDEPMKDKDFPHNIVKHDMPFWVLGNELTKMLQDELGDAYDVKYSHVKELS